MFRSRIEALTSPIVPGATALTLRRGRRWPASGVRLPYWARRLLQIIPVVFLVITINFFLLRLAPGDLADVMAGESGTYTVEFADQLREKFGLAQPVAKQYVAYLGKVLQLDLGWSHRNGQSVLTLVLGRLAATAELVVTALIMAGALGCVLGTAAALTRSKVADALISALSTAGFATPLFWLGLLLVVLFSVRLGWLPSSGRYSLGVELTGWAAFTDRLAHLVLPVTCLAAYYLAIYTRLMRAAVSEIRHHDYVRTARAKGASAGRTMLRHILPNAMLGMITLTGLQFGTLFSGSITIEAVFGWPGLGQLALSAVAARDYNLLLGILLVSSLFVLLVNIVTDLSYALLDPRVELKA
jgi:peptide/nickel transport system permease protein